MVIKGSSTTFVGALTEHSLHKQTVYRRILNHMIGMTCDQPFARSFFKNWRLELVVLVWVRVLQLFSSSADIKKII